jgi:hypothetical protein
VNGSQRSTTIDLLGQREHWIDTHGSTHLIRDMELRYCENVYGYLLRNGRGIAEQLYHRVVFGPQPSGDMACDAVDAMTEELLDAIDRPEAWMMRQPLLEALAERIENSGRQPGATYEVTVVLKLTVPVNKGTGMAQRAFEQALRGLPYEYEVMTFLG